MPEAASESTEPSAPMPAAKESKSPMVSLRGLTKHYGNVVALDNLSLDIGAGEVLGFIGPNGAGKTTTLKILGTLLKPTSGKAYVDGQLVTQRPHEVRKAIGYMPDFCGVYEDMRVHEYLHFFGATYGLSRKRLSSMVDDVLGLTDLVGKRDALADSLSRGMQQRLQLARVLLHDPKVLLLDEPASGLDPRARIEIRMLLKELRDMGKTIIISSHILVELADLCTSIVIIELGKMQYHGSVEAALKQAQSVVAGQLYIELPGRRDEALTLLREQPGITNAAVRDNGIVIEADAEEWDTARLFDLMAEHKFRLSRLEDERVSLEDAFMHLTEGHVT